MFLLFFAKASLTLSRVADRSSLTGGTVIARVPSCQGIRNHQKPSEIIRVYHCTKYSCFKHLQTELAELLAFVWVFCMLLSYRVTLSSDPKSGGALESLCSSLYRCFKDSLETPKQCYTSALVRIPIDATLPFGSHPNSFTVYCFVKCANCMYKSPAGAVKVMQASCELWDKEWTRRRVLIHFSFGHLAYLGVHPYQLIENCEWQSHERTPAATTYIYIICI